MYIHVTQHRISWFCPLPVNYTNYTCLRTSRHLNNDDSPRQVTNSTISVYVFHIVFIYHPQNTHNNNTIIFTITCGNIFQDGRCNKTRSGQPRYPTFINSANTLMLLLRLWNSEPTFPSSRILCNINSRRAVKKKARRK